MTSQLDGFSERELTELLDELSILSGQELEAKLNELGPDFMAEFRWWATIDSEKAQILDDTADMTIEHNSGHEAMEDAGKLWVYYFDILVGAGLEHSLSESICFDGWQLERKLELFHRLSHEYTDFQYPGSGNVVSDDQALLKAAQSLDGRTAPDKEQVKWSYRMNREVFKGMIKRYSK